MLTEGADAKYVINKGGRTACYENNIRFLRLGYFRKAEALTNASANLRVLA